MKDLKDQVREYLALRRGLGYKLRQVEPRLNEFVAFLERKGAVCITAKSAIAWASESANGAMSYYDRLRVVRGFSKYVAAEDSRHERLPDRLAPRPRAIRRPYIYTEQEILRLMEAARNLCSPQGLRCHTYYCLLGLLAVTGLRSGEAVRLHNEDVDLPQGLLTIRDSKFGKSRLVPVHPTTVKALSAYAKRRDAFLGKAGTRTFFISERRGPLSNTGLHNTFVALRCKIGLEKKPARQSPCMHDLRHRFAVHTLLNWYRKGEDVERLLPVLSTFLGHSLIQYTYWYLSSTPELLGEAGKRLEARWEGMR